MTLASFSNLNKSFSSKQALCGASGAIKDGDRIALLGINGSGKTTLLEILAGKIECDFGATEISNSVKRAYLPQVIDVAGESSLLEFVMSGMQTLLEIKQRLDLIHRDLSAKPDDPALLRELGNLQRHFESHDGYNIEFLASDMLRGLGFKDDDFSARLTELSGGQRNRAALARTLVSSPDLLLLDEPTNHLDIFGLEFLENYMNSYRGGILFVSHDRAFIRQTATSIWEMVLGKISSYPGHYDNFVIEREKRLEIMAKTYNAQQQFIAKTQDFIRRNIAGQKTRQAQSRRKMLSRLARLQRPPSSSDVAAIRFGDAERSARIVVKAREASFAYDTLNVLRNLSFEIERGDCIGLVGPNGCGKTTLLNLIMGRLKPQSGKIDLGKKITIGYYDQLTENLNPDSTPLATIGDIRPELNEGQLRSILGKFLFRGEDVFRQVDTFSGGEQSRLALARLIATAPNFLVLDEPTNHLDIMSREALEDALAEFEGTILCVSHDRYFLDKFAEKILILENGTATIHLGTYSEFRQRQLLESRVSSGELRKPSEKNIRTKDREKRVNPLVIQKLDAQISTAEQSIVTVEEALKIEESAADWQKLTRLLDERDRLYNDLDNLYSRRRDLTDNV